MYYQKILDAWKNEVSQINQLPWMQRLASGDFNIKNYKGFLLETYHHAALNPQIQAFTTMFLKNNPRSEIDLFFKHASSEIGHDLLALNDLIALGEDKSSIINTKPLPCTIALNSFVLMQIQFVNPVSYLGYLFHLEFMPTQQGHRHITELKNIGIPESAMSFLIEHANIDIGHNNMMKKYITNLVTNDKDLEDILYTTKITCALHYKMIADAFENGEKFFK